QPAELLAFVRAAARPVGEFLLLDRAAALASLLLRANYVFGYPGFMFRRAAWERKGGVDESLRIASDYEMLCWLCTQGALAVVPGVPYLRRLHEANLSQGKAGAELEVARVHARYRPVAAQLIGRSDPPRGFREWLVTEAYGARQRGQYSEAL